MADSDGFVTAEELFMLRIFPTAKASIAIQQSKPTVHSESEKHLQMDESAEPIEFQRRLVDELRLREIIASSIVVSIYEDDVVYETAASVQASDEGPQHDLGIQQLNVHSRNSKSAHGVPENDQELQVIDVTGTDGNVQVAVVSEANSSVAMPILEQELTVEDEVINGIEMFVPEEGRYQKIGVLQNVGNGSNIAVVSDSGILDGQRIVDEDGAAYYLEEDEGAPILVEEATYGYQNVDGDVYSDESAPSTSKSCSNLRIRLAKQRHIDYVIDRVARKNNGRSRRPQTIYECEDCGKIIRYPSKIEEHRRSHNGMKPFRCTHCGQGFSQKGALTCHIRLHTGERPYQCTWDCGKSFHSNSALKMHERTHNGDRPYSCEVCGKLFTKRSHCQRHESSVHPREAARRALHQFGLSAAGEDEERLRDVVNGVIEEVRIERSLRTDFKVELN